MIPKTRPPKCVECAIPSLAIPPFSIDPSAPSILIASITVRAYSAGKRIGMNLTMKPNSFDGYIFASKAIRAQVTPDNPNPLPFGWIARKKKELKAAAMREKNQRDDIIDCCASYRLKIFNVDNPKV